MTAEITPETLRRAEEAASHCYWNAAFEGIEKAAAIRSLIAHATETCEWKEYNDGDWKSNCGYWYLHAKMDGLANNHIEFCSYCGKRIKETKFALTETPRPATTGEGMGEG